MKYFLFLLGLSLFGQSFSQHIRESQYKTAGINMLIGGTIGGIGAAINKKPNEKALHAFLRGFGLGGIGGGVCYIGKSLLYQNPANKTLAYSWPSRLINSVGASLIDNAASNTSFYNSFGIDLWILRFNLKNNLSKPELRLALGSTMSAAYSWIADGRLNIKRSLQTGSMYFVSTNKSNMFKTGSSAKAYAAYNVIVVNEGFFDKRKISPYGTISHELIHTFQTRQLVSMNRFHDKQNIYLMNKSKIYIGASKFCFIDITPIDAISNLIINSTIEHDYRPKEIESDLLGKHIINNHKH